MLHVGAMLRNGEFVRYDAQDSSLGKQAGTAPPANRKIGDNTQASCVALLLVSREGVIYAHVPPYLCPWMGKNKPAKPTNKDKNLEARLVADWQKQKDEWTRLQSATRKTFRDYKSKLGKYVAHLIMGQYSKPAEAQQMMNEVFGEGSASGHSIDLDTNANHLSRLVVVDQTVNPPVVHLANQGTFTIPGV